MNKTRTAEDNWRAFGKEWFEKHQSKILWCLNAPVIGILARWILRIHKDCHKAEIIDIKPNCYTIEGEKPGEYKTDFRTHWKFAKRIYFAFKHMWWALHWWDEVFADKHAPELSFGFDTLTAYPDAGSGLTTCDGVAGIEAVPGSFSSLRDGDGNYRNSTGTTSNPYLRASANTDEYSSLYRPICMFDTSSLTSSANISSVVYSVYGSLKANDIGSPDFHIAGVTTSENNSISNSDYQNVARTSFASKSYNDYSTSDYNDFTLSSSGISNVSKTDVSKFSEQLSWDILNDTTGLTWSSGNLYSLMRHYLADQSGTSQDPKLVVTYTLPVNWKPQVIMI